MHTSMGLGKILSDAYVTHSMCHADSKWTFPNCQLSSFAGAATEFGSVNLPLMEVMLALVC